MSSGSKGFLLTDSLIGLITAVMIADLCALGVRIRMNQQEIVRSKVKESEEHYEQILSRIQTCVVYVSEEEDEASCSNSF